MRFEEVQNWALSLVDGMSPTEFILPGLMLALVVALLVRAGMRKSDPHDLRHLTRGPKLMGLVALLIFVGAMSGWSIYAPLASATIAPGKVSPEGDRRVVQHLEGGIIREIHVREGDRVEAGAPLVTLDDTEALARQSELVERFLFLLAQDLRISAEIAGESELFPGEEFRKWAAERGEEILSHHRALLKRQVAAKSSRLEAFDARVAQLREHIDGTRRAVEAQEEQVSLIEQEIKTVENLLERGLERLPRLLELKREKAKVAVQIASNLALISRSVEQISETEVERISFLDELAEDALAERLTTRQEIAEIRGQLPNRAFRLERTVIRAPITGQVMKIATTTESGVITPGAAVMEIVPEHEELLVDARVRPIDIDRVRVGMRARLILSAYPQRNLPMIYGDVRSLSADSVQDDRSGEVYFLARVAMEPDVLDTLPGISVSSGMPIEVMFLEEEQTIASYLLSPLRRSFNRSFLEN